MIDDTEKKGNKNMNDNRDFKGVWIPKEVWLDTRLNALDKVILMEIDSLDQGEKGCYASNEHLATFCQCSKTKVSTAISKLIECGYVYIQNFDGRKRELKSRLSNFERQNIKNCNADIQNLKESNTYRNTNNNTNSKLKENNKENNNTPKAEKKERFKAPSVEEVQEYCTERGNNIDAQHFIDYYSARGWMLGKNHIKDWKACIRTWERNDSFKPQKHNEQPEKKYDQNGYESEEELMKMFYGK